MKTFGVKINSGEILKIRAANSFQAAHKAGIEQAHSVWEIGKVYDAQGNLKLKALADR